MTKDFIAICAATFAVGTGMWSLRDHSHDARPQNTESVRVLAADPALKLTSEQSPYMRSER